MLELHDIRITEVNSGDNMLPRKITQGCLAALLMATVFTASAEEITLDAAAAIVNNDIILESELDTAQQSVAEQFRARGSAVNDVSARKAALENLITRSLVLQLARNQGLELNDMQLDQAIAQAATRNGDTPQEFLERLARENGLTVNEARDRFRDEMILSEVRQARVRNRVSVSESEVELLAKSLRNVGSVEPRYHLAQLIVPLSPSASIGQIDRANGIVAHIKAQLRQGANFNDMAARYTEGTMASQAGDLGYLPESQVPVPFLPALLKAQPGDVVGPFRSPFGLHLIKLIDVSTEAVEPIQTYDASHILLTTSVIFSDEKAREELSALRERILSGELSFADAARHYSEDPGSAVSGGSLGYATPERYDPAFASAMVRLKVGEISEPIKSSFGWHLIYLKDVKIDRDSDEAYKDKARDLIFRRLFTEEAVAWERELRESAYIRVLDPVLTQANVIVE